MNRLLVAGVFVAVAAAGGGAFALRGGGGKPAPVSTSTTSTADITRGDMVDTTSVDGTLTYADERTVQAGANGVVTWVPSVGATVGQGGTLMKVNGKPITLCYGDVPLYRALHTGVSNGADVREVESNLAALGYTGFTVDDQFTAATATAIKAWQSDRGLAKTGSVDASQLVCLSGAVRIKEVKAALGSRSAPDQPAFTVTSTRRLVHVDLDAAKQDLARNGERVTIDMPNGNTVNGRISKVSSVAVTTGSGDTKTTTVGVDITLTSAGGTGRLDQAPVTVNLESQRHKNVLSIPVEGLLALRSGGFGVELITATGSRIVPVTTGAFGGGRVEISGPAVSEGMKVGVPAS